MNVAMLLRKSWRLYRTGGFSAVCKRVPELFRVTPDSSFDAQRGTDVAGTVPAWMLGPVIGDNLPHAEKYQPTTEEDFQVILDFLKINPQEWNWVDLGCGKGATLIMATEVGFQSVTGVEFSQKLARIAARQCPHARVVNADAAEFVLPWRDTVLFLFNPFDGYVLRRVIDKLRGFSNRLMVVYLNPRHGQVIDEYDFLHHVGKCRATYDVRVWKNW